MTKNNDQQGEKSAQEFSIPLNKFSNASLTVIRQHTGLDIPGSVRFALVVAAATLRHPFSDNAIRNAAYELGLQDGKNEVPHK